MQHIIDMEVVMRPEDIRDTIEDFTRAQFAFLVESREFRRVKVTKTAWFTQFTYRHKSKGLAFEMVLEFYDQYIIERLVNLAFNQQSAETATNLPKQRTACSFVNAVRNILHGPENELAQYKALITSKLPWDSETYMGIIAAISGIVHNHVHDLMAEPMDVIFAVHPMPQD